MNKEQLKEKTEFDYPSPFKMLFWYIVGLTSFLGVVSGLVYLF